MAIVMPYGDARPKVASDVFLAPTATLIGDVVLASQSSVWFGAVLRGDMGSISIGERTNIQDLACLHMTGGVSEVVVGADVTVGHGAILHGCTIGDRALIGMGSILLDGVEVGEGSVVAAGALVPPRTKIPPRSLVVGHPAKVLREVTDDEAKLGIEGAKHYLDASRNYRLGQLPKGPIG